ncbi:MAG TPA: indolepyruvate oxidoreductase subunit beta family protein [Chloroflexia bacterium]|nr:indolepyruvate oxidoreductase subunit beta family protein [Chloroflexia bacterium]
MSTNTLNGTQIELKSVLLAAIGGQGGNVLIEWLFLAAELDGRRAQALSLPGLSQRGGGTTFYLEIAGIAKSCGDSSRDAEALEQVQFAQFPFPGRVDVLLGQELVELGRLVQGGYASRNTTVVASSQRVYTIGEKMPAFDGVFKSDKIIEATASMAGSISVIDTVELARQNGLGELATNAILLGALSAVPGALPMSEKTYRKAIQAFGLAVDMNLQAFEVGRQYQLNFNREVQQFESAPEQPHGGSHKTFEMASTIPLPGSKEYRPRASQTDGAADSGGAADGGSNKAPTGKPKRQINLTPIRKDSDSGKKKTLDLPALIESRAQALPVRQRSQFKALSQEVVEKWPAPLHATLVEALYQTTDYQDAAYARRYLAMVKRVLEAEPQGESLYRLTDAYARTLAMRMTYEDAVRVAILKIKPGRLERIRRDMGVKPGQVLHVTDYLKPDMDEIYGIFPHALVSPMLLLGKVSGVGQWLGKQHFTLQQHPETTTLRGYLTFRFLTWFKPLRLSSYRFKEEWKLLEKFTGLVVQYAQQNYASGLMVAESGRLVKGYGDTRRKMIAAMQRFYKNILEPLAKWEAQTATKASTDKQSEEVAPFAVTLKAGQAALQLIGRSDEGIDKAEALAKRVLSEAKAGMSRSEILNQTEKWARS